MSETPRYVLVDIRALPEVFGKVVEAKNLIARGKAKNASEAAKLAGISRSAYYKYKDVVFVPEAKGSHTTETFYVVLEDRPGLLSLFLAELYRIGANILTINQNIPVDGAASLSISADIAAIEMEKAQILAHLKQVDGVVEVRLVNAANAK